MPATPSYRLPRTVLPRRYVLELTPDLDAGTFTGTVAIDVEVLEARAEVRLNAVDLDIVEARTSGGQVAEVHPDEPSEQAALRFAEALPVGGHRLELRFAGSLDGGLRGFYRSRFTDTAGTERWLASTQFESTDARRAFPCFDEPDLKAVFSVSLVVPDGLAAVSAGPVAAEEPAGPGRRRVRFADTIPMSTYVLAWVVGPLEAAATGEVDGVPVAVWAPPGRDQLCSFGLEAATHSLGWLARYFDLPYPGDKLDHVAIPDFAFGAMENLGCVTYRETALLTDPVSGSQAERLRIATVVAHETAHMWFGDLVTMKWWNGIWLNEAFATFMEHKTVEAMRPDWDVWASHGPAVAAAMGVDALHATRPVEYEVVAPSDAEAMFDLLTYAKGGAVLRMVEQFLGEDTFRRGISHYLDRHRLGNTEAADLWDALEDVSGQPVRSVMDSWILQAGFPVVAVDRGSDPSSVKLSQRRFVYRGDAAGDWSVPVILRASVDGRVRTRRVLLHQPEEVVFDGPVEWVIANGGGWGFYRAATAAELTPPPDALRNEATPLERFALVSDAWAGVVAGSADPAAALGLLGALGVETDPDVWAAVGGVNGPLWTLDRLVGEDLRPALAALVRDVTAAAMDHLGWDPRPGESPRTAMARGRVIGLRGTIGTDPAVRAEAAVRHRRHLDGGNGIDPDVLGAAITVIARTADAATWEELLAASESSASPHDRMRYLLALGAVGDPDLLRRTLELAMTDRVRIQDGPTLLYMCLADRQGPTVAWPWIEEHWDEILGRFPSNLLAQLFEAFSGLLDPHTTGRIHAWLAAHPAPIGGPRMAQWEERLDVNAALVERLLPRLAGLLG